MESNYSNNSAINALFCRVHNINTKRYSLIHFEQERSSTKQFSSSIIIFMVLLYFPPYLLIDIGQKNKSLHMYVSERNRDGGRRERKSTWTYPFCEQNKEFKPKVIYPFSKNRCIRWN